LPVSESLVVLDKFFEMIRKDDDLLTAKTCHAEFLSTNAGKAYCFPNSGYIGLSSSIVSSLILLEHNISLSKLLVVVDTLEEDFSRKVKTLVEASFSTLKNISLIWFSDEIFKLSQVSLNSHSISKNEFTINKGFFFVSSCHEEVRDKVLVVVLVLSSSNNSLEVLSIFSLDEGINAFTKGCIVKLGETELRPDIL
jgi:hypothetical protein